MICPRKGIFSFFKLVRQPRKNYNGPKGEAHHGHSVFRQQDHRLRQAPGRAVHRRTGRCARAASRLAGRCQGPHIRCAPAGRPRGRDHGVRPDPACRRRLGQGYPARRLSQGIPCRGPRPAAEKAGRAAGLARPGPGKEKDLRGGGPRQGRSGGRAGIHAPCRGGGAVPGADRAAHRPYPPDPQPVRSPWGETMEFTSLPLEEAPWTLFKETLWR